MSLEWHVGVHILSLQLFLLFEFIWKRSGLLSISSDVVSVVLFCRARTHTHGFLFFLCFLLNFGRRRVAAVRLPLPNLPHEGDNVFVSLPCALNHCCSRDYKTKNIPCPSSTDEMWPCSEDDFWCPTSNSQAILSHFLNLPTIKFKNG